MIRMIFVSGVVAALVILALGAAQGTLDPKIGKALVILLPALGFATLMRSPCRASRKGEFA